MVLRKGWLRHRDFILLDVLTIVISLLAADGVSRFLPDGGPLPWQLYLLLPALFLVCGILADAYNGILKRNCGRELVSVLKLDLLTLLITVLLIWFLQMLPPVSWLALLIWAVCHIALSLLIRTGHKAFLRRHYDNVKYARQIVVLATEDAARDMINTVTESAIRNYQFFGLVILDKSMTGQKIGNVTVSADREGLVDYIRKNVVDEVFINIPDDSAQILELTRQLLEMGITAHIYMENSYRQLPNRVIGNVFGCNVLTTTISPATFRQSLLKRTVDILGGLAGCVLTALIAVVIGPIIYIKSPGPIFFSQIRVGKKGREFKIYKFRSMYMDAEARKQELMKQNKIEGGLMFKMDNDPRIIKGIGHFIRKTSLDEFPQFWNVLKGDMSMVGTRPPTIDEYHRYSPHHKRRLCMLPGITGLWQTSGRSSITDFEQVVRLDTEYIENWSFGLDVKIILRTVKKLFRDSDAV